MPPRGQAVFGNGVFGFLLRSSAPSSAPQPPDLQGWTSSLPPICLSSLNSIFIFSRGKPLDFLFCPGRLTIPPAGWSEGAPQPIPPLPAPSRSGRPSDRPRVGAVVAWDPRARGLRWGLFLWPTVMTPGCGSRPSLGFLPSF